MNGENRIFSTLYDWYFARANDRLWPSSASIPRLHPAECPVFDREESRNKITKKKLKESFTQPLIKNKENNNSSFPTWRSGLENLILYSVHEMRFFLPFQRPLAAMSKLQHGRVPTAGSLLDLSFFVSQS